MTNNENKGPYYQSHYHLMEDLKKSFQEHFKKEKEKNEPKPNVE